MEIANRLHSVEEYYFSKKLKEVKALIINKHDVINLGIGSPDLQPPKQVIKALKKSVNKAVAHKYQSYQGIPELREAIAKFYDKQYNVELNTEHEILPLIGSKEGIMHISMAFLNKGDKVLIPNPGYPTYTSVTKLVEAEPVYYNLSATNNWLPNLKALTKQDLSKVKLMWINYPHMPTGVNANTSFFKDLITFAKAHNILVINDNPYSFILNQTPTSLLSIKGALDCCLELNSISKTFNMAGWRVGMLLGNKTYIANILKVKSNIDSGMFYGIQKGAIAALNCSNTWFKNLNKVYKKRRRLIWQLAAALQCTYNKETSGLFVWAKLPKGEHSEAFIDNLLYNKHIFITPGTVFGTQGEGYVRFSLCATQKEIKKAIKRVS